MDEANSDSFSAQVGLRLFEIVDGYCWCVKLMGLMAMGEISLGSRVLLIVAW